MTLQDDIYISNLTFITKSLSVVYLKEGVYYVFDINLIELLEELKLVEYNHLHDRFKRIVYFLLTRSLVKSDTSFVLHDRFKRIVYFLDSSILAIVAIILILYGLYTFTSILLFDNDLQLLHDIFKSIISVTLGLAIFDLSNQIFEHEVLFKSFHHNEAREYKMLGKFLVSIIIALSIETLLVVFKIALSGESENLISAFYLIIGSTVMLIGLAWFYKTINQVTEKEE